VAPKPTPSAGGEAAQRRAERDSRFPRLAVLGLTHPGVWLTLLTARAHCRLRFHLPSTQIPFCQAALQPLTTNVCTQGQGHPIPGAEPSARSSLCRWGPPSFCPDLSARPLYPQGGQHSSQLSIIHKLTDTISRSLLESTVKAVRRNGLTMEPRRIPLVTNRATVTPKPAGHPIQPCFGSQGTFLGAHCHGFMMSRATSLPTAIKTGTLTTEHQL